MSKFGIKSVSYIPLCSTEEIKLEIKKPTGNEIVKKMWDKLDDEEQGFINVMIDRDNKQNEEIERLNKIIEIKNSRIQQLMKRTRSARIDKAIEYIEKRRNSAYIIRLADGGIELINILKGSDIEC